MPNVWIDHSQDPYTWHQGPCIFELSLSPVQDSSAKEGDCAEVAFAHLVARGRLEFHQGYWLLVQARIKEYIR
uniref:Uncharacterized protein n=1 Tax=viral metagenome TaxID=1070528 RepID=A0A6H2A3L0_9ZZZZ